MKRHSEKEINKFLKKINEIFDEKKILQATKIEMLQKPHNYEPSPEVWASGKLTLPDIKSFEKTAGPTCQYHDAAGKKCALPVEKHEMAYGLVLSKRKYAEPGEILDEVCRITNLMEKFDVTYVATLDNFAFSKEDNT